MRKFKKSVSILLSFIMICSVFGAALTTVSAEKAAVTYTEYSSDGSVLQTGEKTVTKYTEVTSSLSTMTSGNYVVNSNTTIENRITVQKGKTANLIVKDGVTLTCKRGIGCGLNKDKSYASLNIYGKGKIVANGTNKSAGIGGNDDEASGNITVHGTTIEATGGKHGAGIGGGEGGKVRDKDITSIMIFAGNITANGGIDGAGIGGGDCQPGSRTYIYGGTVTAKSEKHGAGIGGGDEEGTFGVWIYGGTITATGGEHGAGIGAGEGGGNLRNASDGGGINIYGGDVTATGGDRAAGIGGGFEKDMSGTITLKGENTRVSAYAGQSAAGIGSGSGDGSISNDSDMGGTITIECGENSLINASALPAEILKYGQSYANHLSEYNSYYGAGIGAGFSGNMVGTVYINSGNVNIWSGVGGAGIGGGKESPLSLGGEGGDVYIGGGTIHIYTNLSKGIISDYKNEAIGSGDNDLKSGSVYIGSDVNRTGKRMRVIYTPFNGKMERGETDTASSGDRSKKCHTSAELYISECDHTDHNGVSGLSYNITAYKTSNNSTTPERHIVSCKYCGYSEQTDHKGPGCECGYQSDTCTVETNDDTGTAEAVIVRNGKYNLPDFGDRVLSANVNPPVYYRIKGWKLNGDASGKIYENGETITVDRDMSFTSETEELYQVIFDETAHGSLRADVSNNEAYASVGEAIEFGVEADPGYSVNKVTYSIMTGFDIDPDDYSIEYQYSEPVEIQPVEGKYQLTAPEFTTPAGYDLRNNNLIVISTEITKNSENPIYISESITDGVVSADKETAQENDTVTITAVPDGGYCLDKLRCRAEDGSELELTQVDDTHYTFIMPDMSVSVSADFEPADNFTVLQAIIDSASNGDTVVLGYDYTAKDDESCLTIPSGKLVTIDLNGYTVDRALDDAAANGCVIINNGNLTITDTSTEQTGTITGGYNDSGSEGSGGGILNYGTLTINGGAFTGNKAKEGGAIVNKSGASLTVNGGLFIGNTAVTWGGAGILNQGVMTMNGGTITGNTVSASGMNGGGIWTNSSLTITGGSVTGNTVGGNGGGIYYKGGTISLSGSPVITDNIANGSTNDLHMECDNTLTIAGALTGNAKIGVHRRNDSVLSDAFTSGLGGNGDASAFISNHNGFKVGLNDNGEAYYKRAYFNGHSLTLDGDIGVNYYVALTDAELNEGVTVDFSWTVNGVEKTHSVTLTAADKTANGYKATVNVAVAEMTYDVSAVLTVGGEQTDTDSYSVRQYADVILSDDFESSYTGTGATSYENLERLVRTMLDYGAKAQKQFKCNTGNLANKDINYTMADVDPAVITATQSDMESGLDAYGLEYAGSTIVYLTKTSLRHYYTITDQDKFNAVKNNITFDGEKVGYSGKNGMICFEYKNIAAADLDAPYTLTIGGSSYDYSVLDYVRECLNAENVPHNTYMLVSATYWYNQAANAYFG